MRGRKSIIIIILLLAAAVIGSALAINGQTISSVFQTGGVKISLDQRMERGKTELPFSPPSAFVPGQRISMIPRIKNAAEPCYIRARIVIKMADGAERQIGLKDCYGISDRWVNRGEYLYYTRILEGGRQADLCQGIKIPDNWDNLTASGFKINITAEAVQARNISPRFQCKRPWGRIETELSQVNPDYHVGISRKSAGNGADIVYEDNARSFIINSETFFSDLGAIMPGDKCRDLLRLKNTAGKKIQVLFKATCVDSDLLKQAHLVIKQAGRTIYKGPLACDRLREYHTLANLKKGEQQEIVFTVTVPQELKNPYQELKDQVTWWFAVQDMNGKPVETGDYYPYWTLSSFLLLSAVVIYIIRKRSKRR